MFVIAIFLYDEILKTLMRSVVFVVAMFKSWTSGLRRAARIADNSGYADRPSGRASRIAGLKLLSPVNTLATTPFSAAA